MRKVFLALSFCLPLLSPAMAQIAPPSPQQLQQQSDAAIQNSANSVNQALVQQQLGDIQQQQRRDQLFATAPPYTPPYPPVPYPGPQQGGTPFR